MNELLQAKGLVKVAERSPFLNEIEGPLEEGQQKKVEAGAIQPGSSKLQVA